MMLARGPLRRGRPLALTLALSVAGAGCNSILGNEIHTDDEAVQSTLPEADAGHVGPHDGSPPDEPSHEETADASITA
jgi:hypothetical protein